VSCNGGVDDALRCLGRVHLRHRRLAGDPLGDTILGPGGAVDQQRSGVHLGRHVGEFLLRHLELGERLAEGLAPFDIGDRFVEGAARETECSGADGRAEDVERRHRDLEAVAGAAEEMSPRHTASGEIQRAERMGAR